MEEQQPQQNEIELLLSDFLFDHMTEFDLERQSSLDWNLPIQENHIITNIDLHDDQTIPNIIHTFQGGEETYAQKHEALTVLSVLANHLEYRNGKRLFRKLEKNFEETDPCVVGLKPKCYRLMRERRSPAMLKVWNTVSVEKLQCLFRNSFQKWPVEELVEYMREANEKTSNTSDNHDIVDESNDAIEKIYIILFQMHCNGIPVNQVDAGLLSVFPMFDVEVMTLRACIKHSCDCGECQKFAALYKQHVSKYVDIESDLIQRSTLSEIVWFWTRIKANLLYQLLWWHVVDEVYDETLLLERMAESEEILMHNWSGTFAVAESIHLCSSRQNRQKCDHFKAPNKRQRLRADDTQGTINLDHLLEYTDEIYCEDS